MLATEKGYISETTMGSDFHLAVIQTEDFTPEYVQEMEYIYNLELNFVRNNDIETGDYRLALRGFSNVMRVRPDHAFAYYYAAFCHAKLGNRAQFESHRASFVEFSRTPFWVEYCDRYGLSEQTLDTIVADDVLSATGQAPDARLAAKYGP